MPPPPSSVDYRSDLLTCYSCSHTKSIIIAFWWSTMRRKEEIVKSLFFRLYSLLTTSIFLSHNTMCTYASDRCRLRGFRGKWNSWNNGWNVKLFVVDSNLPIYPPSNVVISTKSRRHLWTWKWKLIQWRKKNLLNEYWGSWSQALSTFHFIFILLEWGDFDCSNNAIWPSVVMPNSE